jgi:hypothetical protein
MPECIENVLEVGSDGFFINIIVEISSPFGT